MAELIDRQSNVQEKAAGKGVAKLIRAGLLEEVAAGGCCRSGDAYDNFHGIDRLGSFIGAAIYNDAAACSRSTRFSTLPDGLRGKLSTMSTLDGTL